jgi:HlyD family secretion protein
VLRVPTQAIRQNGKVLAVDEEDRLVERSPEMGLANWAFTEVISGLKEGERVLLSSDEEDVKAGVKVKEQAAEP